MQRISIYQIQDGDKMLEMAATVNELITGRDADGYTISASRYGQLATQKWVSSQLKSHSSTVAKFNLMVMNQLPEEEDEIDPSAIYLIPNSKTGGNNMYTEYIWNSANDDWEIVGSQVLDLDGVLTEQTADEKYLGINDKATSAVIADSATTAASAVIADGIKTIKLKTVSGIYSSTQIDFDAKSDISINLPETISADITGNAATADMAQGALVSIYSSEAGIANSSVSVTPIMLQIIDYAGSAAGETITIKGGESLNVEMPEIFKGTLNGNAATATKLKNSPKITISSDTAETNTITFTGESDVTLPLPPYLNLTVANAEKASQDKNGNDIYDNYARTAELDLSYCTRQERSDILEEIRKLQDRIKYLEDNMVVQKS